MANEEKKSVGNFFWQIHIYLNTIPKTNTNTNIFWRTSANMNTNLII